MTVGWSTAERLLCVRLDALGDVLMTGPALRALKRLHPGVRVTLLCSPAGAAIAPYLPGVDAVTTYEAPWMKATAARAQALADRVFIQHLRGEGFQAAVIFTSYSQSALPAAQLCYLADIPLRLAHCRENPYRLLTDWVLDTEPHAQARHEVQRQLDLAAHVGAAQKDKHMALRLPSACLANAAQQLASRDIDPESPWVVMHPGASAASRRYHPADFAAVARRLVLDHGCTIVFTGARAEIELVDRIRADMGAASHSVAGQLGIGELCGLIALAPVLISNNTAPVHIAAAVGTSVVDLYALTNPQHTPWLVESRVLSHDVPCKYCYKSVCPQGHHGCLRGVAPEAVVRATLELLARRHAAAPSQAGVGG